MSDDSLATPAAPVENPREEPVTGQAEAPNNGRRWAKIGVGAAIGSAAIAAALLYANRPNRNNRP